MAQKFEVRGGAVWVLPTETVEANGSKSSSMGFRLCTVAEDVEGGAEVIAAALNRSAETELDRHDRSEISSAAVSWIMRVIAVLCSPAAIDPAERSSLVSGLSQLEAELKRGIARGLF